MREKEDATLNDVRRYGDLVNRKDWVYDRQNHSSFNRCTPAKK